MNKRSIFSKNDPHLRKVWDCASPLALLGHNLPNEKHQRAGAIPDATAREKTSVCSLQNT